MNIINKIKKHGVRKSLSIGISKVNRYSSLRFCKWKHRNAPSFISPTEKDLFNIERKLLAIGVEVIDYFPDKVSFEEFIDKNEQAVILLDGIEYLISNNGFNPVLRFIRRLIDKISETSTILLIGVSSKAMNEQELKLLEREMNPIIVS